MKVTMTHRSTGRYLLFCLLLLQFLGTAQGGTEPEALAPGLYRFAQNGEKPGANASGSVHSSSILPGSILPGSGSQIEASMKTDKYPEEGVSRELAIERKARIADLRYRISFDLKPDSDRIHGSAEIAFKLASTTDPVILDFRDLDANGAVINGRVNAVTINGRKVTDAGQLNGHILLPAAHFKTGENAIGLDFESGSAAAGRPVIRYSDKDDGSRYIYTLFVPMDASLAFPCFDQPDLKARFTLTLKTPKDWTAFSNEKLIEAESVNKVTTGAVHSFGQTHPISTYQFAFAAGPFRAFSPAEKSDVPLSLIVRKSQAGKVDVHLREVFKLTSEGMRHFIDYFDHRFPFSKYDQVLLPGFAYGGMEHAGATFLREDAIIFRTTPTKSDRMGRASLILHELAHQWFGDLVTMRWFDDLWLKEGFANFMAFHAMASIYRDPDLPLERQEADIWRRFYQRHKPLAYAIDSTRGTTPIYQQVSNLKDAKSAYGAIVYQKAPSLLHALSFHIGEEAFRSGVRIFLKEHAYGNAEWNDLIRAFEQASRIKLGAWASAWVKQRGMPQIDIDCHCNEKNRIDRFELRQHDILNEGSLWPIKTRILLFGEDGKNERITVEFDGPSLKVGDAIDKPCPAFIFLNDGDFGYGRFMLDARSHQAVIERIDRIDDPFLRTMLWGALWDSVRETVMNPADYSALALRALSVEADEELTGSLLDRLMRVYTRYLSPEHRHSMGPEIEALCFDKMQKAPNAGLRITWFRAFRSLAGSPEARSQLKKILAGEITAEGVEIKQLDRWRIVSTLLAYGDAEAEALLAAERKRDASDDGRKQAYIAEASRADASTKRRYFEGFTRDRSIPEDWVEGSLVNFNHWNQSALTAEWLGPALASLPQIKRERKIFFVLAWLNAFIGGQQSDTAPAKAALKEVQTFLRNTIDRDLELKILEVTDELQRTVRIRDKFGSAN